MDISAAYRARHTAQVTAVRHMPNCIIVLGMKLTGSTLQISFL